MKIIWSIEINFVYLHYNKRIKIMKPWLVTFNGCGIKDYKRKSAAIKYAKMKKAHSPSDAVIYVVSPMECIEI